jgi:hypothetical protein
MDSQKMQSWVDTDLIPSESIDLLPSSLHTNESIHPLQATRRGGPDRDAPQQLLLGTLLFVLPVALLGLSPHPTTPGSPPPPPGPRAPVKCESGLELTSAAMN